MFIMSLSAFIEHNNKSQLSLNAASGDHYGHELSLQSIDNPPPNYIQRIETLCALLLDFD